MEEIIRLHQKLTIHYFREGKGQPLVFIHGLGGSLNNWKDSYDFFLEKGFQVIGLDLPGYGKSFKPKSKMGIPYYGQVLKDFIQFLKLKELPVLVGNSMGGHIGIYYAAKYKSRLKGLVLVNSSGLNEMNFLQELLVNFTFEQSRIGAILKHLTDLSTLNLFYDISCPNARVFVEEQKEMSKRQDYPLYCYALEESTQAMMNYPVKDILSEIKVPSLILWGENDRLIPSFYSEQFHKGLQGSTLHYIKKCGHIPEMEKPEVFNSLLLEWILGSNLQNSRSGGSLIGKLFKYFKEER